MSFYGFLKFLLLLALGTAIGLLIRGLILRERTLRRLEETQATRAPARFWRSAGTFPTRYWILPVLVGILVMLLARLGVGLDLRLACSLGLLAWVLAFLIEHSYALSRIIKIEEQLTEALDMMIATLRAGAGLNSALQVAMEESKPPLRPYLEQIVLQLQLGQSFSEAVEELGNRVPLEPFRLLAVSLAALSQAGGSLATVLTSIAITNRDRLDVLRQVRAQSVHARLASIMVMAIAYSLFVMGYIAAPSLYHPFLASNLGSVLLSIAVCFQAIGLLWIHRRSQVHF